MDATVSTGTIDVFKELNVVKQVVLRKWEAEQDIPDQRYTRLGLVKIEVDYDEDFVELFLPASQFREEFSGTNGCCVVDASAIRYRFYLTN